MPKTLPRKTQKPAAQPAAAPKPIDYETRKAEMIMLRKPPYSWSYEMIAAEMRRRYGGTMTKQRVFQIIGKISRYGTIFLD